MERAFSETVIPDNDEKEGEGRISKPLGGVVEGRKEEGG